MNETLSVIDEHITDMNSPHHSIVIDRRGTNDSGSEYSIHQEHRMSYINGEETDEEEDATHTKEEVLTWTPDQVAEYLFTAGVETKHCEVFRDQEITGDVLLGMDQTSVFLKEFELGSVGRRLKTWQKIKVLQDEVNGSTRRNTATYGSEVSSDDAGRSRSRSEASTMASSSMAASTTLPRIPSLQERPGSRQNARLSQQHLNRSDTVKQSPISPKSVPEGSPRPTGEKRPSAASIRDLHHSRQNSANDFSTISLMSTIAGDVRASPKAQDGHKKQPSFDRNWTMGNATPPLLSASPLPSRPLSSAGLSSDHLSSGAAKSTLDPLDRGYFSGGESESGRQRNVLRKRAGSSATHSRNSSYTDEQRLRSATAHSRHSRFGSVDSIRDSAPPSAAQKYYGLNAGPAVGYITTRSRRTPSESSINAPPRPAPPPKDIPSPIVTKLEGTPYEKVVEPMSPNSRRQGSGSDWLLPVKPISQTKVFGLRTISDAVTGHEKAKVGSPTEMKDSPLQSPSIKTGSSSPSGGPSFDLESPDGKVASAMTTPGSLRPAKRKAKKETSAYTRGLEKKTPKEQMEGADYFGWMKKKNSTLMATWKPRLFILKGRRLSYYYSEDDTEEKGLIDISYHKVLPADNERLTGLHATLTGATNSPTSPFGAYETVAAKEALAQPPELNSNNKSGTSSMFIFKLQPPKVGTARGLNFTKPTVHYFATPDIREGRLWMAALVKATIERDETIPIKSTYQQTTISLEKARRMRHRPPALMNLDEHVDEEAMKTPASDKNGLNIHGIIFDRESHEGDSGVSGITKSDRPKPESAGLSNGNGVTVNNSEEPKTA